MKGYVKFNGEFSKLKGLGFEFQKLFASNYMQWHKEGFRVWKKGSDITHDDFDLYKLVKFLRLMPVGRRIGDGISYFKFYKQGSQSEFDWEEWTEENVDYWRNNLREWQFVTDDMPDGKIPQYIGTQVVPDKVVDFIRDWMKKGWLEVVDLPSEN